MLNRLQDVFRCFHAHDVRYVVIGGITAILYGVPRATFDLDILIEATSKNARRLLDALRDAGFGTAALTDEEHILANEITIFKDRFGSMCKPRLPDCALLTPGMPKTRLNFRGRHFFSSRNRT
ncbi:MAG: nucleotidyltransferase family protein [bacterium]|nr:nucleotidyltransferase family protein [bacterium]